MIKYNNNLCHDEISKKPFDINLLNFINQYKFMVNILCNKFDPNPTKYFSTL